MSNKITINLNQSPYFDDFDKTKNYHQVLYKPALPVQARELTTEQSILRNQIKNFGDHVFMNGSKVTGADTTLNLDFEYVKLQQQFNAVDIDVSLFKGKTVVGSQSGTRALVLHHEALDTATGDPDVLFLKYITGGSMTEQVQGVAVNDGGTGYLTIPTVTISGGDGLGATATATIANGSVISVDITSKGTGYTSTPSVSIVGGGGNGAFGTVTLSTAASFLGGERISAVDGSVSAEAYETSPTGKGSSAAINEGVFYINGNFIQIAEQLIILDKFTNTPSYKIGVGVAETVVDSGTDTTLLDNAQGSHNFAAPGADRLMLVLTLSKKVLTSIDDTDFYEVLRVKDGIKQKDITIPIYSVLEETFARRTFDESGSYTVRAFNIQVKDDPDDSSKFIVRLDPGKAFVEGHEFETIISKDLSLDKARDYVNVNNFDRLMQYGNYAVVKDYLGLFNITEHTEVDLHNQAHASTTLTNPTTYASTKIGTARVRNIDYVSGTGTVQILNMYLYDIKITSASATFADVESIIDPVDPAATPVLISAGANIDDSGKEGGASGGDAKMFETSDNRLVFKLPQETIKTIRDDTGVIDTSYTIRRVFENVVFAGGIATIATGGSTETFLGSGALSDSNKKEFYTTTIRTVGTSGLTFGELVAFDGGGQSITVNAPSNTTVTFNDNSGSNSFTADIIATINIDSKQEKVKTLVPSNLLINATPNTTNLEYDDLAISDIYKYHAVFDSEDPAIDPVLPTLTVTSTIDSYLAGEIITGATSNATGIVIEGDVATTPTEITYVPLTGIFVEENISGAIAGFTKDVTNVAEGDANITSRYELDNGQRDNFYDHGRIKLKADQTAPVGRITIVFDYFTHAGVGYLSADSYTSAVGYDAVPTFTSPVTGDTVELRDCVDFRPRRVDGGTALQNIELPYPNTNWSADYSYYLPRVDNVYLSREKVFGVNQGVSSLHEIPPYRLNGTMDLYTIFIPAYTFKAKDVQALYIENKRYTMRDIGKLEKRLSNVEYYTSLSLLEKEAESLVIKDTAGLDRFKNGILVDSFNGHSIGNILSPDYKCSIDFDAKILRPPFASNLTDLLYMVAPDSVGVQKTGDLITLPYTIKEFIDQPTASKSVNINPFAVLAWIGVVELDPPNDNWIDTTTRPDVVVNLQGENDGWAALVGLGFGSQFNDWETINGTGRETVTASSTRRAGLAIVRDQTVINQVLQTRTGIRNEITGVDTVRNSIGDRVVDVSIIPFIRARDVSISVTGMKPNTKVYPFFDSENVALYCTPSGGVIADDIYTDDSGSISNLTFSIPNSDTIRFRTGERQFLLVDNIQGDLITASTYAEVTYQAQGLLQTQENVIVATRVPRVQQFGMGSATDFRTQSNTFTRSNVIGWIDPLAETFLVDQTLYPDGIFISDVDLYFKTKDSDGLPVSLQIRDTLNGYPAQSVLPFSDVSLTPDLVNTSEDASVATKFTFPGLVYLQPGEYAIVVLSNSLKYEAYIAEHGENIIGTNRKVSSQPYAGSLFKSQNASTWTPNQNQDLTFKINRADYTINTTSYAVFRDGTSTEEYKADIIQIVPEEIVMNNTSINWGVKLTDVGSVTMDAEYTNVVQKTNHKLAAQRRITTGAGSYEARAILRSNNSHISPVIDTARNSVITIENLINNDTTNETDAEGGNSIARYITRRVNLKDGFDATDLNVHLTAIREAGSSITVYYKVLSQFDTDTFDNRPWTEMGEVSNLNSVSGSDADAEYLELEFSPAGINANYISNLVTYNSFKTFAIKVVMTSANTTRVPLIRDLRVIALA